MWQYLENSAPVARVANVTLTRKLSGKISKHAKSTSILLVLVEYYYTMQDLENVWFSALLVLI